MRLSNGKCTNTNIPVLGVTQAHLLFACKAQLSDATDGRPPVFSILSAFGLKCFLRIGVLLRRDDARLLDDSDDEHDKFSGKSDRSRGRWSNTGGEGGEESTRDTGSFTFSSLALTWGAFSAFLWGLAEGFRESIGRTLLTAGTRTGRSSESAVTLRGRSRGGPDIEGIEGLIRERGAALGGLGRSRRSGLNKKYACENCGLWPVAFGLGVMEMEILKFVTTKHCSAECQWNEPNIIRSAREKALAHFALLFFFFLGNILFLIKMGCEIPNPCGIFAHLDENYVICTKLNAHLTTGLPTHADKHRFR